VYLATDTIIENQNNVVSKCKKKIFAISITGYGGPIFVIFSNFAQTLRAFNSFVYKITYKRPFASKLQASNFTYL
jgi:hypothetical protein